MWELKDSIQNSLKSRVEGERKGLGEGEGVNPRDDYPLMVEAFL